MRSLSWGRRSQTDTRAERARPEDGAAESAPWDWFRNEVAVLGWRSRTDARAELARPEDGAAESAPWRGERVSRRLSRRSRRSASPRRVACRVLRARDRRRR